MARAWKARWVQALGGSNPPFSALMVARNYWAPWHVYALHIYLMCSLMCNLYSLTAFLVFSSFSIASRCMVGVT